MLTTRNTSALVGGASAPPTPRDAEKQKYSKAYESRAYRMGDARKGSAAADLDDLPRGSLLDVGCGRGELLDLAEIMGFGPVKGVEVVDYLIDGERVVKGDAWALPFEDNSFDVVTMFDVIEHLLPGDDELACRELERVARKHVILTAHDSSHVFDGVELHVNLRPYDRWNELFLNWFGGRVDWLPRGNNISETWLVTL